MLLELLSALEHSLPLVISLPWVISLPLVVFSPLVTRVHLHGHFKDQSSRCPQSVLKNEGMLL